MAHTFSGREGQLRIYDGSNPPYYVEVPFVQMNFSGPTARARPEDPIVPTVGGYVHAPQGPDYDGAFYAPSPISFSFWAEKRTFAPIRNALTNIGLNSTWTVGGNTWVTTKGRGSIIMADGTFRATQAFYDTKKVAADVQVRWRDVVSGSLIGMRYDETYFPPQSVTILESADYVEVQVSALAYGNIEQIGDFTTGNASVAYEE